MGLFKRKEAPQNLNQEASEMGIELNTYDAEKEDEPTDAEMGRERVDKIMAGAKELWSKMAGKLSSLAGGAKERAKDLLFKGTGSLEKGAKKTVKEIKGAYAYTTETVGEAADIGKAGLEWGTDVAKRDYAQTKEDAKAIYNKSAELGYTGAALAIIGTEAGYNMVKDLGKKGIEIGSEKMKKAFNTLKESGIDLGVNVAVLALEGIIKTEEMGIDAKKWLEGKGRKGLEIYKDTVSGTKELWKKGVEAKNNLWNRVTAAKDRFMSWKNENRTLVANQAKLEGKIEEMAEEIARLRSLVEARNRLDTAEPEPELFDFSEYNEMDETQELNLPDNYTPEGQNAQDTLAA